MKKKNILLALLAVLVILQFFQIDKSNPPADPSADMIATLNPPAQIADLMKSACYDCHSHHTEYPWYTYVQPMGWWIRGHIRGARNHVNFSEWTGYAADDKVHNLREIAEVVTEEEMPLQSFTWMHPEARLSGEQRDQIAQWAESAAAGRNVTGGGGGESDQEEHDHEDHEH